MFKKKDKPGKDTTPDGKGKKTGTVRPNSDPVSPRGNEGGGENGAGVAADDGVMSFQLGDTRLGLTHKKLLGDTHFYDMELLLGGHHKKNPPTRAHRAVLHVRCPGLLQEGKFVSKIDKKKDRWTTTISETALPTLSPAVLGQLMIYVYSGSMEVQRFALATLLDMCAVAAALSMEEIVWQCEHRVRELLNIESVHSILKGAEDRQLVGVKNFSLEYAFKNWNDFIGNQEGAKILGLELFQDVSARYAKGDKVTYPEGPQPANTIVADYRRMYEEMPMADLQIEVGSEKLACHRAILAMYSDALAARFKNLLKHGGVHAIKLIDPVPDAFQNGELQAASSVVSFLKFVYYGETKMDAIDACEMIHKVNSVFKLVTFQILCEHTIINNINIRSVIPILGVTYIKGFDAKPHVQALRKQALGFIMAHFGEVDLTPLGNMPPEIRTDLLMTLQTSFKTGKLGQPYEGSTDQGRSRSNSHSHGSHGAADDEPAVAVEDSE